MSQKTTELRTDTSAKAASKSSAPKRKGSTQPRTEPAQFPELPCAECEGYVATYFAVNIIPTYAHLCTRCFNKLKPPQLQQFYVRKPL